MNDYFAVSNVSIIGAFVSSTPVSCEGGGAADIGFDM